jgi:quercetin dioxygenase-like cupin family protein
MFSKKNPEGYHHPLEGIRRKTLVWGRNTLTTEFLLDKDTDLPVHSHPQEQTGYLVSGNMIMTIGDEEHIVRPGDSWCIPGGVDHGARILEDSVAVEVFSPVREDYLDG